MGRIVGEGSNLNKIDMNNKQQELQWQAESDASTMARYQEILGDKSRMQRAIKVAKQQAADLTKRASAMQSVSQTKANSFGNGGRMKSAGKSAGSCRTSGGRRKK